LIFHISVFSLTAAKQNIVLKRKSGENIEGKQYQDAKRILAINVSKKL